MSTRPAQTPLRSTWPFAVAFPVLIMVSIAACGFLYTLSEIGIFGSALVIGVATVPPIVLAALLLYLDRLEPEPHGLLWLTFAAGGTMAIAATMIVNIPVIGVTAEAFGWAAADLFGSVVMAPLTEELAKGTILLALFAWRRRDIHGVVDGIVYGSMVGLGFAFSENIVYFSDALGLGLEEFVTTVGLRAVMSAFAHPLFTSMTGIGFAMAAEKGRVRWVWPIVGVLGAMGLHAIWNLTAVLGAAWYVAYVLVFIPLVAVVVGAGVVAARREATLIRAGLARHVELGLLTSDEVEEVATLRIRRAALRLLEKRGGAPAREARAAFHRAGTRLAFERDRGGYAASDSAGELFLAREIARYKRSVDPAWPMPAGLE